MALAVRGSNPIWSEFDLTGNLFDDTFYLFVLQNTIPYIPLPVYQDPDMDTPWTNPIRFLANGTLPDNIYYVSDTVYRLEFRKGDSQNDPLIYEINNYIPGSGGSTPVDTVAFLSTNQITNPQFALINFSSPFTYTGLASSLPTPGVIQIGPGWYLDVAGTGSVTITQVPLTSVDPTTSNAPYALEINVSGWTENSVLLRQRFFQSGVLWSNKIVSTAITSKVNGLNANISSSLIDSQGNTLGQLLSTTVDSAFNEYTGHAQLLQSIDTDTPPAAYIDYVLALPSSIDIYVTSIQVTVQDLPIEPGFEQDSINRQIDYTYNTAYPIVPVGTIIDFGGFNVPKHYLQCNGTAYSRVTYNLLFQALTNIETVTLNSSNMFTVANGAIYYVGMSLEGTGIPASTTISNISINTITISHAATVSASSTLRFFAWGDGDGSTTFNVPDLTDEITAGSSGVMFTSSGVGFQGGDNTVALIPNNLPAHVHPPLTGTAFWDNTSGGTNAPGGGSSMISEATTGYNTTTNTPVNIIQQTSLVLKCIRFE